MAGGCALFLYNNIFTFTLLKSKSSQEIADPPEDSLIASVQSSTRVLISAFRDKTNLLTNCSDLKLLLREGYQKDIAKRASQEFFRNSKVSFVAIDGTESQDESLGMLIFYAGAFGYGGQLEFSDHGCDCGEVVQARHSSAFL